MRSSRSQDGILNRIAPAVLGGALVLLPCIVHAQETAQGAVSPGPQIAAASPSPEPSARSGAENNPNAGQGEQQNAAKRNPLSPASQPALPPQSNGLLGDFGHGDRTSLAKQGFTLSGHLVSEGAGNITGGTPLGGTAVARGTAVSSELAFGFDADFGTIAAKSGAGILHLLITERFGSSLAAQTLGNLVSVQEIYGDGQTTRFTELNYEQPLLHSHVDIKLGKINQEDDFIAGSTYWGGNLYCFYQNNNICGTPAAVPINNGVVRLGTEGYVYYPSTVWGVRVKGSPAPDFYIEAAALQANPVINTRAGGAYFGFYGSTGTELPLETGLTLRNKAGDLIGNVRVGGYFDTSTVQSYKNRLSTYSVSNNPSNVAGLATIPLQYVRGRSGADVQFDHLLEGSSKPNETGTVLFLASTYSDPNSALISSFFDAGIVRRGTFAHRKNDTVGVGFATENFNPRLQNFELQLQSLGYAIPYTGSEKAFEFNYGWQAASWWLLRPGFQYVLNPNGEETNIPRGLTVPKSALVFGLTSVITF